MHPAFRIGFEKQALARTIAGALGGGLGAGAGAALAAPEGEKTRNALVAGTTGALGGGFLGAVERLGPRVLQFSPGVIAAGAGLGGLLGGAGIGLASRINRKGE